MLTHKNVCFFSLWVVLLILCSCAKEFDNLSWDSSVTTPVAKAKLTLGDIIEEDSLIKKNDDNSYSLVYRDEIYTFSNPLDSFVDIQIRPLIKDVTLESLELEPQSFESKVTLNELLGDNVFFKILFPDQTWVDNNFNGTSFPVTLDPINVDFSNILQRAILTKGKLNIRLDNQLPLDIKGINFTIKNAVGGQVVYQGSYDVNSEQTIVDEVDLAQKLNGQSIEGQLVVELGTVSVSPAQGPDSLFIDYSDAFTAAITLSDLKVSEADAIFPAQNIVEAKDTVGLIGLGDVELTRAIIKQGRISTIVSSTVESEMFIEYYVPSAVRNGQIFNFKATVPAAPSDGSISIDKEFSYDGYDFDFTGKDGDLTNAFYNELYARIENTGQIIHLSLQDTISLAIQVEELIPSYVEGYLGQQVFEIDPDTIFFNAFDDIKAGAFSFETAKLEITVENGLGVDGELVFNQLAAINSKTGQKVNFPNIPSFPIQEASNLGNGFLSSTQRFQVDKAVSILNILPDKIYYNISGVLNPGGNVPAYSDFIYDNAELKAYLDLEVPFSFNATNLVLSDTISFDQESQQRPEEIQNGVLRFIVQNEFPLDARLKVYALDEQNQLIDSLVTTDKILAANSSQNSVSQSQESVVEYYVEKARLENVLKARKYVFEIAFASPTSAYTKLYADYSIEVLMTVDFNYRVSSGL